MAVKDYLRERFFPHIWCPGCGHGTVLNGLLRAVDQLGMSKNEIVMVSGIGCSGHRRGDRRTQEEQENRYRRGVVPYPQGEYYRERVP